MRKKYKDLLIYCVIVLLQILVILYWSREKTNYHVDELYSLGYSSCFTGGGDRTLYITTSLDFEFDKWISNYELKKYIMMSEQEKFYNVPLKAFVKDIIVGRNYFGLLNVSQSVLGISDVSQKAALLLNVLFFVGAEIALVYLLNCLNVEKHIVFLCLAMFGFSVYMISMVEYIRFYMLLIMIAVVVLCLFRNIWESDKWSTIIISDFIIVILVYIAYKDSELTMPFFGALLVCFTISSALAGKRKQVISCIIVFSLGLSFLLVTTNFIGILIKPTAYQYLNNVWVSSSLNISNASIGTMKEYLMWLAELLTNHLFSSRWIIYLLIAAITICVIVTSENTIEKSRKTDILNVCPETIVFLLIWIAILVVSFIMGHMRAFSALMVYIVAVMVGVEIIGFKLKTMKIRLSGDTRFVLAIAGGTFIYTLFEAMCQHMIWRYYCYGFVMCIVVFWYCIDRSVKRLVLVNNRKFIYLILTVFVVINGLIPFKTRNIENIYEDEKDFIDRVQQFDGLDVVLISEIDGDTVSRHEAYDCVNLMSEESNICFIDIVKYGKHTVAFPDEFILWSYMERDITEVLNDLRRSGFKVIELGSDHCSKAYVCSK